MSSLLISDARVLTPRATLAGGWVAVRDGRIAAIGPASAPPPGDLLEHLAVDGAWVLPGFLDVHTHGAVGHDTMDADPAGLEAIAAHQARHGVTGFLPTTWTASHAATLAALETVSHLQGRALPGATVLGAHLEGPYLNPRRCGAQDQRDIRPAEPDEVSAYLATGVVRLITLAPEIAQNLAVVPICRRAGVTVSIGHSDATFEQVRAAVAAGVRHATHTGNAMRPLHHREPGTLGGVLDHPPVRAEVIADGLHVHPALLRLVHGVKGSDGMLLVTDAIGATGLSEGAFDLAGRPVEVRDGAVRLSDGTLAGSVLTMDRALRTLVEATGLGLEQLWPTVSRTPARTIGVEDHKGSLIAGADGDLVVLDDSLQVLATIVGGRVVHRAPAQRRKDSLAEAADEDTNGHLRRAAVPRAVGQRPERGARAVPHLLPAVHAGADPRSDHVRIGIVGAGSMGTVHAEGWAATDAELVAICAEPGSPPTELAGRYGARACATLEELINLVDVVDVCAPTDLHDAITLEAAAAGRHVICEKPLARTSVQARAMITACRDAGVQLHVGHVVRFFPEYARAKRIVDQGTIGVPAVLRFTRASYAPKGRDDDWFADPSRSGGLLLDLMIHDLDQAWWMAGPVTKVLARSRAALRPGSGPDHCLAVLTHEQGAITHVEASWAYPPPVFRTRFEVAGTTGVLDHDSDRDAPVRMVTASRHDHADVPIPGSPLAESPYTTQLRHVLAVLRGQAEPVVRAEDGLAALLVAEAAERSLTTGRVELVAPREVSP